MGQISTAILMLINIPPILSYVRSEYLYEDMVGKPAFQDATVFALSSRPNMPLCFQAMIDNNSLFSNVPVAALTNRREAVKLAEDACIYQVFPDDNVSVVVLEYLTTLDNCRVYNKDGTYWQDGQYVFTVEWELLGEQLHLIELEDGNYVFWGNGGLEWGNQ